LTIGDYYYRVDSEKKINLIKDKVLRACYWQQNSFPHKILTEILEANPNQRVYRVCFYDTEAFARARLQEFSSPMHIFGNGVQMLTRWPRNAPSSAGFTCSQDDGFNFGEALLYWALDPSSGELSSKGIALSLAEVWDEGQKHWVSLFKKYPSLNSKLGAPASKTLSTGTIVNTVEGTGGGPVQKRNGRLKGCMDWLLGKLLRK